MSDGRTWDFQTSRDNYTNEHYTPPELVEKLAEDLGVVFTLDPCATPESAKAERFFTIHDNGLAQDWSGEVVFCNPPYSDIKEWIIKCANSGAALVAALVPCRFDTSVFQEVVLGSASRLLLVRGRVKFGNALHAAPFPSVIIIWDRERRGNPIAEAWKPKRDPLHSLQLFPDVEIVDRPVVPHDAGINFTLDDED